MALVFNRDFEPRTGEAVAVAPSVRRVTADNPGPFTFRGTNTFLIGEAELAVLDPGPDDPDHIAALLRAIGDAKVAAIVLTHTHRDHWPAAPVLAQRFGAPIHVSAAHDPSRPPHADVALEDGVIVTAGALKLQAIATPGHAADHMVFALLDHGILFSGDHVMGWSTTIVAPPDGSMAAYMASLDRLLQRPERLYLPAHGAAIPDGHAYVAGLLEHRREREAAILAALREGESDIPGLVAGIYRGLDPALGDAAALSVFAHLQDLVARDLVATQGTPSLDGRYSLADATPATAPGVG